MKTILDKINKADEIQASKVELGKHEVELGAIQDLEKLIVNAQKDLDAFNKSSKELKTLAKTVVTSGDSFRTNTKAIGDLGFVLEKQFKELGLNYLENPTVRKAVAIIRQDFDVRTITDSARQLTK
jgi:hypothetical protein